MKEQQDYTKDIAEIRSMMERSSKFLSLSGWTGILAGIYSLIGALIAYYYLNYTPGSSYFLSETPGTHSPDVPGLIRLALIILLLAISTAFFLSHKTAKQKGEAGWNPTSKRLLISMIIPLAAGGILMIILLAKNLFPLLAPVSLIFYGLSLYNAGKFTFHEVTIMGYVNLILGLLSAYFIEYSLLFWALGFGVVHIIYGIYMYFRYDR